jgi:hypothetical protein
VDGQEAAEILDALAAIAGEGCANERETEGERTDSSEQGAEKHGGGRRQETAGRAFDFLGGTMRVPNGGGAASRAKSSRPAASAARGARSMRLRRAQWW